MAWTQDSDTCMAVYEILLKLKQVDMRTLFSDMGPLTMKDLQFFNTAASNDSVAASAAALARLIDGMLVNSFAATVNGDEDTATAAIASTLATGTNTVENLSDTIASKYTIG